jgi:phosphoribosylamine--glycine ligase
MNILVIGSGGREHALVWKMSRSVLAKKIYCAPGNAGIASLAELVDIPIDDIAKLKAFAKEKRIDLTVAGPEVPLVKGIVDEFEKDGMKIFGPSKAAANLEGSKVFSKEFMRKYGIPTSGFEVFTDEKKAIEYIRSKGSAVVIKADGLAAGKGVVVAKDAEEAEEAVHRMIVAKEFGEAGSKIIVEDCLFGEEASILAFTDGKTIVPMASSQDHKRIFNNDMGPNTGGMGAYSPAPLVTDELFKRIDKEILKPTVSGIREEGMAYKGVIYVGVMVTKNGPMVLEYNARFGDPETQAILPRMKSDIVDIMLAVVDQKLDRVKIDWDRKACVSVVMASGGYPGPFEKGKEIKGLIVASRLKDTVVFHAGTKFESGKVVSSGGRVLGVTALGDTIKSAIDNAYKAVKLISFDGAHFRSDIGQKALK